MAEKNCNVKTSSKKSDNNNIAMELSFEKKKREGGSLFKQKLTEKLDVANSQSGEKVRARVRRRYRKDRVEGKQYIWRD